MMRKRIFMAVAGFCAAVFFARTGGVLMAADDMACKQAVPPVAASQPASQTASQPASQPETDPEALKILDALEQTGEKYAALRAEIDYHVHMAQTDDSERRTGYVSYRKKTDKTAACFRVHFDTLQLGEGAKLAEKVDYAFDGMWLSVAKHRAKNLTRYQVAAEGETVEPLRIGKGSFPLPFGQKTADVVKCFQVVTRPAREDEPKDADYLLMIPRPEQAGEMSFTRLEMWVDRATRLPVRVVSLDKSRNTTTVVFTKTQTDVKFDDKEFLLPQPFGWTVRVEPLREGANLKP